MVLKMKILLTSKKLMKLDLLKKIFDTKMLIIMLMINSSEESEEGSYDREIVME